MPEQVLSYYERGWSYGNLFSKPKDEELNFLKKLDKYCYSWQKTRYNLRTI